MISDRILRRLLKPLVFLAALTPAGHLVWAGFAGHLSANPLADITNSTGDWTLRFLCIALAVTPLRRLTGWNGAIRFRRMLGLFAFFYGVLHFLTYIVFDRLASVEFAGNISWTIVHGLATAVIDDVYERPFITIGFTAFMLMVPLHRLMYVSCIGAVAHYWWLVKADVRRPVAYGTVVVFLLTLRVYWARAAAGAGFSTKSRSPFRSVTVRSGRTPSSSSG
jgi:sulfoxide reductase heme-binding subunit YedZ